MKKKLPTIKSLEAKLDRVFAKWIIARDGKCVICGKNEYQTTLNCGHLFSRRNRATRWDELNCHCQCFPDNFKHQFDTHPYNNWFIQRYGLDSWNELYKKHHTTRHFKRWELEEMIKKYDSKS